MAEKKVDSKKAPKAKKSKAAATEKKEEDKVETLTAELAQEKEKYLRLFAEFENYKKRTSKERIELFKTAGQEVLQALLPVADDFERALGQQAEEDGSPEAEGFRLIQNKFIDILKGQGLSPMEITIGDQFDAEMHEAITQIPAPSPEHQGAIIDVIEKGYQLGDKIIRFPKVVVGK
ncbi:MAG: nucleotide exchange factor GrpE [Flavobacteriaceae bacterium]